jgi:FdrA protein
MENKLKELLEQDLVAINVGLYDFAESLQTQGAKTIHVNWTPPAGGDQELIDLLDQLL